MKVKLGQRVIPTEKFAYRPPCVVIDVGEDENGAYFVAKYPNGETHKQYHAESGTEDARFQKLERK